MHQLSRLLRYVRPYRLHISAAVVFMALGGALNGFRILLIGPILDRVLNPASRSENIVLFTIPGTEQHIYLQQFMPDRLQNAWSLVAFALVSTAVLKGLFDYFGAYLVNYAGFGAITDIRNQLYDSVLRRSVGFFQKHSTGKLVSTIINDIDKIQHTMSHVLAEFLEQIFVLIFMVGVVIALGGKLAWVLLLFVPFILFSSARIGRRVRTTTRTGQDKLADIQHILQETITGNRIVKAFSMERWEIARFRDAAARLFRANLRSVRASALASPLMDIIGMVAISLLLLLGREQIKDGVFTPGSFVGFIAAVYSLYSPVKKMAMYYSQFQGALGASSSIFTFMDEADDVKEKLGAVKLPSFSDSVRFENVGFSYQENGEGSRQVLRDIDLNVRRGEVLALVGSSGAGKTTLVNLIPRFFDVTSGALVIDGHDVRDVTIDSLRANIGIVTQETILFNDTVRNNIAYGHGEVAQEVVEAAAKAALAHDFILRMPEGYDTVIGERGLKLSGGERQRIAIARAILKNAPILILDEATSALDTESEALVQSALQNLMTGRTVFVIAHRLSTVRRADRIAVLEAGRIADIGTHDELLSRLGTYKRLYDLQFADEPITSADTVLRD